MQAEETKKDLKKPLFDAENKLLTLSIYSITAFHKIYPFLMMYLLKNQIC